MRFFRCMSVLLAIVFAGIDLPAAVWEVPFLNCDGKPGSILNANVPFKSGFTLTGHNGKKPQADTKVKMFCDAKYIYAGIVAMEPAMDKVRATADNARYSIWNNDCVEVNYDPEGRNNKLGKIFVDANGNISDLFGFDDNTGNERFVMVKGRSSGAKLISFKKHSDRWTVELAIPFGALMDGTLPEHFTPRMNINRTRRSAENEASSLFYIPRNNHNLPRYYAEMKFAKFDFARYKFQLEASSIKAKRTNGKLSAVTTIRVLNKTGKLRMVKAMGTLYSTRGEELGQAGKTVIAYPNQLMAAEIEIPVTREGRMQLCAAIADPSGAQLAANVTEQNLSYAPLSIKVTSPAYRNSIFSTMKGFKEVRADIIINEPLKQPLTVTLQGKNYKKSINIAKPQAVNQVTFPFANMPDGNYTLTAGSVKTVIRKLPPNQSEVYFDAQGITYINGEKFLPFGACYALPDWNPPGVNCTVTPAIWHKLEQIQNYLDTMHKHNMKVLFYPYLDPDYRQGRRDFSHDQRKSSKLTQRQKDLVAQVVKLTRNHPAFLAYYVADEPEGWGHNEDWYVDLRNYLEELDPYHPVAICNYGTAGQKRFHIACDLLKPDTYPNYYNDDSTELGRRSIFDHAMHATRLRPAWHTLQAFDWGKPGVNGKVGRAPTYEELREQLFSSLLGNMKGFQWYCFNSWGVFSNQTRIGREHLAAEILPFKEIMLETTDFNIKFSGVKNERDFLAGMKQFKGEKVIIAVNLSNDPVKAVLTSQVKLPAQLAVAGEKRQITVKNNRFTDSFAPHEVHIYTTDKLAADKFDLAKVRAEIALAERNRKRPGNLAASGELSYAETMEYKKGNIKPGIPKVTSSSEWPSTLHPNQATQYFIQDGVRRTNRLDLMTWSPKADDPAPWIEIDFGKTVTAGRSEIFMRKGDSFDIIRSGRLSIPDGKGGFKVIAQFSGNTKPELTIKHAPVKTNRLRLELKDFPRNKRLIHEWEVYEK